MNPFALTAEERAGAMMAPARAPDVGAFMDNIEALRAAMGGSLASRMARRGDEQVARWQAGERSPTPMTEENIWLADDVAGALLGPMGMAGVIKAYHGSPHRFSKFSMDKIGTGEGAQAYGHGLYFAESPGVAKSYQDGLSRARNDYGSIKVDGKTLKPRNEAETWAALHLNARGGLEDAITAARDDLERNRSRLKASANQDKEQGIAFLESLRGKNVEGVDPGALYTTRLDVEPEDLLDWDAPLSEQSPKVRAAVQEKARDAESFKGPMRRVAEAVKSGDWDAITGSQAYTLLGGYNDPTGASAALREAGIPGIRYLDQGSRASGEGTRNFVIFDDSLISIESVD